jgi:hypothetical protein
MTAATHGSHMPAYIAEHLLKAIDTISVTDDNGEELCNHDERDD